MGKPLMRQGPYSSVALADQIRAWREWKATGKRPEQHPAVRASSISPPEDGIFHVIDRLSVNEKWTDQSWIQCNVCNCAHKFISDGYLAAYDDGYWYVVGPVCGSDEHQKAVARAVKDHQRREAESIAVGLISDFIRQFDDWQNCYTTVRSAAETVFAYHKTMRRIAPRTFGYLEQIQKAGGLLRIIEKDGCINPETGRYEPASTKTVGQLLGAEFFQKRCLAMIYFRDAAKHLDEIFSESGGLDRLNELIISGADKGELNQLQRSLSNGIDSLKHAYREYQIARSALSEINLQSLTQWRAHRKCEYDFRVGYEIAGTSIRINFFDDKPPPGHSGNIDSFGCSQLTIRFKDFPTIGFEHLGLDEIEASAA